ncbi:MAG: GNAT family N-acetyltransferase [archaeon]
MVIIEAKDFILRPAKKSDLQSYYENKRNDIALSDGFFGYKLPYTVQAAKENLDRAVKAAKSENSVFFIIDINGEAVGEVMYEDIIPKLKAKVGYWIGKEFRNKGIMTQAVKLSSDYVFKRYKLRRIYGNVRTSNKASARMLEKAGFKLEGIQRKSTLKHEEYHDDFLYAKVI